MSLYNFIDHKQEQEIIAHVYTSGCPKKLAELIRAGKYDPSQVHRMTTTEVKDLCAEADIGVSALSTKVLCMKPNSYNYKFQEYINYTVQYIVVSL